MRKINKRVTKLLKTGSELTYLTDIVPQCGAIVENVSYVDDKTQEHKLDVIYPVNRKEIYPFIINIHGGGFAVNTKDRIYRNYAMRLAGNKYAVVNINFRLSYTDKFPVQMYDVFAVLDFIEKNHERFHLDINNMFLCGDSSGAYMAAMTDCISKSTELSAHFGLSSNLKCRALALNCGFYDFSTCMGKDVKFPMTKGILIQLFGQKDFYNHEEFKYSSVINYLTDDFAPAYIADTQIKSFATEGARLYTLLCRQGIDSQLHIFNKKDKLLHAFNIAGKYEQSAQVLNETFTFFDKHLK